MCLSTEIQVWNKGCPSLWQTPNNHTMENSSLWNRGTRPLVGLPSLFLLSTPSINGTSTLGLPLDYLPFCCKPPNLIHAIQLCKKQWCDHTRENMNSYLGNLSLFVQAPTHHTIDSSLCLYSTGYKILLWCSTLQSTWKRAMIYICTPATACSSVHNNTRCVPVQTLYSSTWDHIVKAIIVYICIHNYCQFKWTQKYPTHHTFL